MDVKQRIRNLIAERSLTVTGVSIKAGLSNSALGKYLNNDGVSMTVDNLERVAKAIGVTLYSLVRDDEDLKLENEIAILLTQVPKGDRKRVQSIISTFIEDESDHKALKKWGGEE